jgi:hypothetical protein
MMKPIVKETDQQIPTTRVEEKIAIEGEPLRFNGNYVLLVGSDSTPGCLVIIH